VDQVDVFLGVAGGCLQVEGGGRIVGWRIRGGVMRSGQGGHMQKKGCSAETLNSLLPSPFSASLSSYLSSTHSDLPYAQSILKFSTAKEPPPDWTRRRS
jgi:hypothetical protein